MVSSIPDETLEQKKRVEGLKRLLPEKIASFVATLASDQTAHVSCQILVAGILRFISSPSHDRSGPPIPLMVGHQKPTWSGLLDV
tara:strand:+ start:1037 stop:1291 length:255 start_codon:yes stop_codon:yes gene_type:complete